MPMQRKVALPMSTLKDLIKGAERGDIKIVTGPHSDWLERLEHEQVPNQKAMNHVIRVLLRQYKHPRKGRFSPSSMGECPRRIIFSFAGAPEMQADINNQEMMDHGSFGHLKWQIEGLTMGYMDEAEKWVYDADLLTGGSIDAVLYDGSLFELKTAAMGVYNRIVVDLREPKYENLLQLAIYFLLTGASWASVVYENRGVGLFHEFRVAADMKIEREVVRRLKSYKRYVEDDALPPMLDNCEQRIGTTYRRCAFREICPIPKKISDVDDLAKKVDESRLIPLEEVAPTWATALLQHIAAMEKLEEFQQTPKE
jgi:hypothetical protein